MNYFKNIHLTNFRNFESFKIEFSKNCNVFYGKNGSGKTNLLESISLLSKGRGLRKDKIDNIIKKNFDKFYVKSDFYHNNIIYNLSLESIKKNNKQTKSLKINNDSSKQNLENFYKLTPFLNFVPDTERLFISSPANRRNLIDSFIYSYSNIYNKLINIYNKNILERSKLLSKNSYDINWLDKIEENISEYGMKVYLNRNELINNLINNLNFFLKEFKLPYFLSIKLNDTFFNEYLTEEAFKSKLEENRKIDSLIGGSKIGPHKSDFIFYFDKEYLVSQLSTGQQKTIILILYLSQCKYLSDKYNLYPILLLDEVCSHLDEVNRNILLTLVESFYLQVFMTGTTKNLFSFLSTNSDFYNITT